MTPPLAAKVNYFHGATQRTPFKTRTLAQALKEIRQGTYKRTVEQLRAVLATRGREAYTQQKISLDAITPCGTFTPTRSKATLTQHSGIVHGDLDHLQDLDATRQTLCSDPHTVYCFASPSGEGLKIGVRIDPVADDAAYKHAWQTLADDHQQYGIVWDPSGKDISRLCFMSWDPESYVNPDASIFPVPGIVVPPPRPQTRSHPRDIPADRRQRYAQQRLERAVKMIDASTLGNRHDARRRAAYLLGGVIAGEVLSYDEAYAALEAAVARNTDDVARSMQTIQDGLKAGMDQPISLEDLEAEHLEWRQATGRTSHTGHAPPAPAAPPAPSLSPRSDEGQHTTNPQDPGSPPPFTPPTHVIDPTQEEYPYSDAYNALQLIRTHGANMRYCPAWKSWLTWTGTHWQRDTTGLLIRWQRHTVKALGIHVPDLTDTAAKALMGHIKSSLNTTRLKAAVEQAQSWEGMSIDHDVLDADPWLLNCHNGTLDLRTGTLRPHRQTDLLTKCLPLDYDPQAPCATWEQFLWRIMGGSQGTDHPDMSAGELENRHAADALAQRLITFLQRALGYSLTGDTREQCLFVLHGSGSNGKSTLLEILQALLNDYAQSTPSASLLAKNHHDHIQNDIARLRGARLITAVEIGDGKRLNEELVKRLTGQDTLTARFLHAEFFDFTAEFKLFIACNHLPTIRGTDHAIWRRIRLIPFTVTLSEAEQDKDLPRKLRTELPGILHWAVQGCLAWQREGLGTPDEVQAATAGYRASMDVLGAFLDEQCTIAPYAKIKASRLYKAYQDWCQDTGEQTLVQRNFGLQLSERGYKRYRTQGTHWWQGLGLSQQDTETR